MSNIDVLQLLNNWQFGMTASNLKTYSKNIQYWLSRLEKNTAVWVITARRALEMMRNVLDKEHGEVMPEMGCQRSGKCCARQVPRVSVFELETMAAEIAKMPEEKRNDILERCRNSVTADYKNAVLGSGVPCPLLGKDEEGHHICEVHSVRPVTCWAAGVTTPLSWDCPLWEVHAKRFPVLPPEKVQPFLDLFAYCRNVYCRAILEAPDNRQMMLVGVGILALLNERPPKAQDQLVTAVFPHRDTCSADVYMRTMKPAEAAAT